MSFGFTVRGKDACALRDAAAVEFAKVVEAQPSHERDMRSARKAFDTYADVLSPVGEGGEMVAHVAGSISTTNAGDCIAVSLSIRFDVESAQPRGVA